MSISPIAGSITELVKFEGNYVPENFMRNQTNMIIGENALSEEIYAIGQNAFYDCTSIDISHLPLELTTVCSYAFGKSQDAIGGALSSLHTLLDSLQFIGPSGFEGTGIVQLYCNNLTYVGRGAFSYCEDLVSITLPNSITYIAPCFYESLNLTDIYCEWYEGDVEGAPWGASNTTRIHYLGEEESSSSDEGSSSEMSSSSNESSSSDESSSSSSGS